MYLLMSRIIRISDRQKQSVRVFCQRAALGLSDDGFEQRRHHRLFRRRLLES